MSAIREAFLAKKFLGMLRKNGWWHSPITVKCESAPPSLKKKKKYKKIRPWNCTWSQRLATLSLTLIPQLSIDDKQLKVESQLVVKEHLI